MKEFGSLYGRLAERMGKVELENEALKKENQLLKDKISSLEYDIADWEDRYYSLRSDSEGDNV